MMAWTDRHCRYLHRLAAPHALLFTEMVTTGALLHGPAERLLRFDPSEHPVALQLGGSDPGELREAAALAAERGFDEINLNVGCPSPRVKQGRFGACLMREPDVVARCVAAMAEAVNVPVTVKCRLGVDDQDSEAFLQRFVDTVAGAGSVTFYVHARKALLNGLSPAENRTVPPLLYGRVHDLKARRGDLEIIVNGGVCSVAEVDAHLDAVDGVMIGRTAYQQPLTLAAMDAHLFPGAGSADLAGERPQVSAETSGPDARRIFDGYRRYIEAELAAGTRLADMTRHVLGLFAGQPGARRFRRVLSDAPRLKTNDPALLDEALAALAPVRRAA